MELSVVLRRPVEQKVHPIQQQKWPEIFNNDSTLTSALLDRLLRHSETVVIEGKSYRMKDQIES